MFDLAVSTSSSNLTPLFTEEETEAWRNEVAYLRVIAMLVVRGKAQSTPFWSMVGIRPPNHTPQAVVAHQAPIMPPSPFWVDRKAHGEW